MWLADCASRKPQSVSADGNCTFYPNSPPILIFLVTLLGTLSSILHSRMALELENLALRHPAAVGWAEVEMKLNDALARNWSCGYTLGMKTAISIPNDLFDGAERLARRTSRSRSRLFTDALREYLLRHAPDKVTESMDQAIMEVGEGKDEFVSSVARRRLERTEW